MSKFRLKRAAGFAAFVSAACIFATGCATIYTRQIGDESDGAVYRTSSDGSKDIKPLNAAQEGVDSALKPVLAAVFGGAKLISAISQNAAPEVGGWMGYEVAADFDADRFSKLKTELKNGGFEVETDMVSRDGENSIFNIVCSRRGSGALYMLNIVSSVDEPKTILVFVTTGQTDTAPGE